ncbi:MAG: flagellar protein FlaG [Uliginosibacterium sp.]|jgi:flagellar protein FlaG|nr:flagellar protein FlaG [Uliginosibacterium sp.]MBK9614572.1 flagellar protein FlaG [Uliginosibacterium sp.]
MAMQPIPGMSFLSQANATTQPPQVRPRVIVESPADTESAGLKPVAEEAAPVAAAAQAGKPPSQEQIDQAMKEVKQALPFQARDLQFSIDNETGRTVIKIVDPATKEVIRQMPSEELLAITRALDKFTGLLTKQKV